MADVQPRAHTPKLAPPQGWQTGGRAELMHQVVRLGYPLDRITWTWDPRPMPGEVRSKLAWGWGRFPGFTANEGDEPFLEAHLFWGAEGDSILEVAILVERDNRMRWIWEQHHGVEAWAQVAQGALKGVPQARVHPTGAMVLLPVGSAQGES